MAYATASVATAAVGVDRGEAAIHYSGTIDHVFNAPPGGFHEEFFPLGPTAELVFFHERAASGVRGSALFAISGLGCSFRGAFGFYPYVSKVEAGVSVRSGPFIPDVAFAGRLAVGYGYPQSQWTLAGTGFVVFRFDLGLGLQYGWARLTMDGAPGNSFTLVDYAWGDVGDSFLTGQVPEPCSLALLAVGAVGLLAMRRQRAKAV
jgi:hypothetical protein